MESFETFEEAVHEALPHLYDPVYRAPDRLWHGLGLEAPHALAGGSPEATTAWCDVFVQAINDLKPGAGVPPGARVRRIYGMLYYRYVENLTQEETAARLGISSRHLRREQYEAMHVLALRLWRSNEAAATGAGEPVAGKGELTGAQPRQTSGERASPPEWRAQVKQELASLRVGAPYAVAGVGEVVVEAAGVAGTLTARRGVRLETAVAQCDMAVAVPAAALRQVLLAAIGELVGRMAGGTILVEASQSAAGQPAALSVQLRVSGSPIPDGPLPDTEPMAEMLDAPESAVTAVLTPGAPGAPQPVAAGMAFMIELPAVEHTVVVVDDNLDMAHLYRRYTTGTGFYIVHVAKGGKLFEAIESCHPALIVLDVMLPDVDGWALLSQLHEHPLAGRIPVVVCSVVREDALAMALGAAAYLRKPIGREQFLQTLAQAVAAGG